MKKEIAVLLMLAVFSGIVCAGVLDLDEGNIIGGTYIIQDGTTYKIVYRAETYFNGESLKRLVVENTDEIKELQARITNVSTGIETMSSSVIEMANLRNQLEPEIEKSSSILEFLEAQLNISNKTMTALRQRQDEIKSIITTNILLSQSSYEIALVVFIALLVIVLLFKVLPAAAGKPKPKTNSKKGTLDMIMQEIKGKPEEKPEGVKFEYGISYDVKQDNDK